MKQVWVKNGYIAPMTAGNGVFVGHLLTENDRIVYVGEQAPPSEIVKPDANVMDGSGLLFMPGLVNTHGHAAMTLLRGYSDDQKLKVWLEDNMWPMEAKYETRDTRAGAELAIVEMLLSGTTTFVDMYDRMDQVAEAVEIAGMRGCLTRGVIGFGSEQMREEKLAEAKNFARNWHGQANGRITAMLSPHAPYTCSPEYIARFVDAAHELDLPLHTHMSETLAEVEQNVAEYGKRPVAHLDALGFFSRPALLAHAVHLTDEEIALLAERGAAVSHNPISNLKLASGVARVPDLLAAGVVVSLGTDSAASNNNLDLFGEIRMASLIHKGVSGDPTVVPALASLQMGTIQGARSILLDKEIGTLEQGKKADFIAINIEQTHYYPHTDLLSHLAYSGTGNDVRHVWVDGVQVVKDRECVFLDEEKVRFAAQASFERLSGR